MVNGEFRRPGTQAFIIQLSTFNIHYWAVALACLAALPYLPTLANGLVWDDVAHIVLNGNLTSAAGVLGYFQRLEGPYYRPAIS